MARAGISKTKEKAENLTQMMNQSLSKVRAKVEVRKVKARRNPKRRARVKENSNPTLVHPDRIDPLKLVWRPAKREDPPKGSGRRNYRALRTQTLHDWLYKMEHEKLLEEGGDIKNPNQHG